MQSELPAWVQAGAAVAGLAITAWLASLTRRYVRLTKTIAKTGSRQLEGALAIAKNAQTAIAKALVQEVNRIRQGFASKPSVELSETTDFSDYHWIHQWFHPIIPQVSNADPEAVALFLKLEDQLSRYRSVLESLAEAKSQLTRETESLERARQIMAPPPDNLSISLEQLAINLEATEGRVRTAEQNLSAAAEVALACHALCTDVLNELRARLSRL